MSDWATFTGVTKNGVLVQFTGEAILRFVGEYEVFSNFKGGPVIYENVWYPYSENAFQAAKFPPHQRALFPDLTPGQAKRLGRSMPCRTDWEQVKVGVMRTILRDKFIRNVPNRRTLIGSGDRLIVEGNLHGDEIWGMVEVTPGNWRGQNLLGFLLMQLRAELR